ncbi:MAG: ABC transporter permease, partial [Deltaproteobacteria bacterium]|nr:ABC transporter permease [Deltaproteobacteria bacterium]
FTTVPIGGVWIGTAALVLVLSVMSGFESDLREKILGSNAHIQITREEGEFEGWQAIKSQIDKIPGVVASTPFAVSEVVIAANNNGMNVIIKGIDPATVGKVTDLVADLDDPGAMKRLEPLIDDSHDRTVPQPDKKPGDVLDPPPDDMPSGGDPIDLSGGVAPSAGSAGSGSAGSGSDATRAVPDPDRAKTGVYDDYGGDAIKVLGIPDSALPPAMRKPDKAEIVDPPPADLMVSDEAPLDFSGPDTLYKVDPSDAITKHDSLDSAIRVIEPFDSPLMSRRTQSLPGILVGRELVKQTHLYNGEEVRVVSPLSDPANPDATGTPIPFNRDYRVAGTFYTGMYEYDLKYVYVTLDSLNEFLDRGDTIDGIEIRIDNPDDTDAFVAQISKQLGPSYRVQDWKELNRSLFSALKLEKIAMFLVLGIVILVASFSIVGNLIMVVVEKAREIAVLKTLGASDWGVMQMFAIQGLMIGLFGTVLGVLTGLLGCWAGKRFGLPLNPDVYYIDRLPIHVDPTSVAASAAAGILISIAATLYPALLAARVRPAAGMRH